VRHYVNIQDIIHNTLYVSFIHSSWRIIIMYYLNIVYCLLVIIYYLLLCAPFGGQRSEREHAEMRACLFFFLRHSVSVFFGGIT
jgi:hypothetical protein